MKLEPIGKMVVVLKDPKPKAAGRIHLPDNGQQVSIFGKVLAVGPDTVNNLKGKRVVVPELGGQLIRNEDGTELTIIEEDFIRAYVLDE